MHMVLMYMKFLSLPQIDIPETMEGSFYRGQVHVGLKTLYSRHQAHSLMLQSLRISWKLKVLVRLCYMLVSGSNLLRLKLKVLMYLVEMVTPSNCVGFLQGISVYTLLKNLTLWLRIKIFFQNAI